MSQKVQCYVRPFRRRWGLSQQEVASVIGGGGRNRVSRVERGLRQPDAREILAYSLLFGAHEARVFPRLYDKLEERMMRGAYRLDQRLARLRSPAALRKRELLDKLRARVMKRRNPRNV